MSLTSTAKALLNFFFAFLLHFRASAQDSILTTKSSSVAYLDTVKNEFVYPFSKKKVRTVALTNIAVYSGMMAGLYSAWYKDYPQSKFHFFNDGDEWLQIDKIGHAFSAYAQSRASLEFWRTSGISRKKRILLGGFSGAAYQTVIETLDGFSAEWGWSWGDFAANMIGSGMLVGQEFAWDEQRVQFKVSFHKLHYSDQTLNKRSDELFGSSLAERSLKDYNGQTYWLSLNLRSFFPQSRLPKWLQLSVGTGAEGLFGARSNFDTDKNGLVSFSRPDIPRYRQWYLAPDIDLTKIKTRKKGIKLALNILSIVKIPAPSLEYSKKGFSVNWLHF